MKNVLLLFVIIPSYSFGQMTEKGKHLTDFKTIDRCMGRKRGGEPGKDFTVYTKVQLLQKNR